MIEPTEPRPAELPHLFVIHRTRPGLLLRELAWRWSCGSLLLAISAYEAWRIWRISQPALARCGILQYSSLSSTLQVLTDPTPLLTAGGIAVHTLAPLVIHAVLGLLPLFLFVWVFAFGWCRTYVLRQWDASLPNRPLLLAQAEAVRLGATVLLGVVWMSAARVFVELLTAASAARLLLEGLLLLAAVGGLFTIGRFRPTLIVATGMTLLTGGPLVRQLRPAWRLMSDPALQPLRAAVRKSRIAMGLLAIVLAFVPSPFPLGWRLLAWWVAWSLPALAAADAWRLGAFFTLLRTLRTNAAQPYPALH